MLKAFFVTISCTLIPICIIRLAEKIFVKFLNKMIFLMDILTTTKTPMSAQDVGVLVI